MPEYLTTRELAELLRIKERKVYELPVWLHRYNWHRPHGGLQSNPPISRLGLARDNLLRLHS